MSREALEASLDFKFMSRNLLITFHPVTLKKNASAAELAELLTVLDSLKDTGLIFTLPNSDTEGRDLIRMVDTFVSQHPNARSYPSLGQLRYLSCMNEVDGVVGNSSSGLIEAPTLRKGTINIGDRQAGRIKADSVIDCLPERNDIMRALDRLYSHNFLEMLRTVCNPYGEPGASEKIIAIVGSLDLNVLKKKFHKVDPICE
jgi:GDP/UDP-N,N'-diacetylbacillosamine 2-epimerase (hydrolysing)